MPNFAPTEEQEEIRKLAHSIAVEQLRPHGRSAEKNGEISLELLHTLVETGLTTPFPEEYGGSGRLEAVTYTLIAEELGFGDGGLAMNIIGSLMGPVTVMLTGNENQKGHYITPFSDEVEGYIRFGSLAFAERTGGYNLADISATARKEGDHYILNGTKRDVIHGGRARPRVALVRLEGTSGLDGLCAIVLPPEVHGMHVRSDVQKLGLAAATSTSFIFASARVAASDMLGNAGDSGVVRAATLYQILRAAVACGISRAALEYARDYAKERVAFGRPIASYQGIAFIIAEMAMNLDAVRLLTWRAATGWDRNEDDALATLVQVAEVAQYQAVKLAKLATTDAVQVMGGAGFIQDHPAEMWMRDAAAME
jgi:alkylation response protein AidB-like acyl-CoA dehydrogenase